MIDAEKKGKNVSSAHNSYIIDMLIRTLLSAIMAALLDHKASSWSLSWNITLLAPHYTVISLLNFLLLTFDTIHISDL